MAERTVLCADQSMGQTNRMDVMTSASLAKTLTGSADIILRDRALTIESIAVGDTGDLKLESNSAPAMLAN